jgi:hypothetical protein
MGEIFQFKFSATIGDYVEKSLNAAFCFGDAIFLCFNILIRISQILPKLELMEQPLDKARVIGICCFVKQQFTHVTIKKGKK